MMSISRIFSPTGGGNATVPITAIFQPPQAFADNAAIFYVDMFLGSCVIQNQGITSVLGLSPGDRGFYDTLLLADAYLATQPFAGVGLNLSGNAITNINAILASCVAADPNLVSTTKPTIDLSSGTSVAPTGQGITDKATLIGAGWGVTTN